MRPQHLGGMKMSEMRVTTSKPQKHPEGYAVDLWMWETKLATTYGGTPEEAQRRATQAANAFEARPWSGRDALDRAREVDYQRYKRSHPDSTVSADRRKELIRLMRENFDPTPPNWEGRDWDDNADDVADKMLALFATTEGRGFAKCEASVVAMLEAMAVQENEKEFIARASVDSEKPNMNLSAASRHTHRAHALQQAAFAVSSGQLRTVDRDPSEILAAHRRIINRSQASKAGRASAASKSQEERSRKR